MSVEELRKEIEDIKAQLRSSDEAKRAEAKKAYEEFRKKHGNVYLPGEKPGPEPGPEDCGPDPDPNNEHVKVGGWGGDTASPKTWSAVAMKDDPKLWKIVDTAGKNIAHKFASKAEADTFIGYHVCQVEKGGVDPIPVPTPTPTPTPTPGPGTPGAYPYPAIGTPMQSTTRGPTTRHYASGKPDDQTIEKNVKNIKFKNYQFVSYVTMNEIEHSDTLSTKLGGTHMGSGWFDHGISFGDGKGQCCLGTEKRHPSTQLCVIKGPQLGEIVGKKVGVAATYFTDQNFTEFWVDLGDGKGWKKQLEGKDVNNFNPGSDVDECQLRIDGFKKGSVPTIHSSIVTEIAAKGTTPTPVPSPCQPIPCPPNMRFDMQLCKCVPVDTPTPTPEPTPTPGTGEVKEIYPGTGAKTDFYYKSSNAGRSQWKSDIPKCWLNQEVTAYLKIAKVSNMGEEVSIKLRGGNHGSPASEGSCYIMGIGYDGSVNCQYEKPHPSNHSLSSTVVTPSPLGNNIVGKSFGIKGIVYQQGDHDKIECWIDKGGLDAAGKPANQWVKFWETTSKVFFGKCNGGSGGEKAYLRMDDVSGDPKSAVDVKFASVREIKPPS